MEGTLGSVRDGADGTGELIFRTFLETWSLRETQEVCRRHLSRDVDRTFDQIRRLRSISLEDFEKHLFRCEKELRPLYATFFLYLRQNDLSDSDLDHLHYLMTAWFFDGHSAQVKQVRMMQATRIFNQGQPREGLKILESIYRTAPASGSVFDEYVHHLALANLGLYCMQAGDFSSSHGYLNEAVERSEQRGFRGLLIHARQWRAELWWASLQLERALAEHQRPEDRDFARTRHLFGWLVNSHNSAAKVALDLGRADVAREELNRSAQILERHRDAIPRIAEGYFLLFLGEWISRHGSPDAHEAAVRRLEEALDLFCNLPQRHVKGVLEARIALLENTMRKDGVSQPAIDQLDQIVKECSEHEFVYARLRALLVKCYYDVRYRHMDRDAYYELLSDVDETIARTELVNHPVLLSRILLHLYGYVTENLGAQEQERIARRIESLRPFLEQSCYESIYGQLHEDRFRQQLDERVETE